MKDEGPCVEKKLEKYDNVQKIEKNVQKIEKKIEMEEENEMITLMLVVIRVARVPLLLPPRRRRWSRQELRE